MLTDEEMLEVAKKFMVFNSNDKIELMIHNDLINLFFFSQIQLHQA